MAVAVMSPGRQQEFAPHYVPPVDPLDQILKGLSIAAGIYNIKSDMDKSDLSKLQQQKLAREQASEAEQETLLKSSTAPVSVLARQYYSKALGGAPVPETMSAHQLKGTIDPKKLFEAEAMGATKFQSASDLAKLQAGFQAEAQDKKLTAEEKAQGRKFTQDEILQRNKIEADKILQDNKLKAEKDKLNAKNVKEKEADKTLNIPGYTISPDIMPSKIEARSLRTAVSDSKTLNDIINKTADLADKASTSELANPTSDVRNKIASNLKQAQLLYKGPAFAQLGVLSGPDMGILDSIVENPVTMSALIKGTSGVSSRLRALTENINSNVQNKLSVSGYIPAEDGNKPSEKAAFGVSAKDVVSAAKAELIRRQGLKQGLGK